MKKASVVPILTVLFLTVSSAGAQEAMEAPPPLIPGVRVYTDLSYVPNGRQRQKLDLYVPEKPEAPLPLLVWIHGGAWRYGDKRNCPILPWCDKGYVVASINYRLCERSKFPAQIEDCRSAIRWLKAHAEAYKTDPSRIAVWGESAGGHLAALVGTSGDFPGWDDGRCRVGAVIDWFGRMDLTPVSTDPAWAGTASAYLLGGSGEQVSKLARQASPISHVSKDDPPFLIMHGDRDGLVPLGQSRAFAEALTKAGVKTKLVILPGVGHGGEEFLQETRVREIDAFLEKYLRLENRTAQ